MGRCVVLLALVACGRVNFDKLDDSGSTARCRFTRVALGEATTCALDERGGVWCWGANELGQTSLPPSMEPVLAGTPVPLSRPAVELGVGVVSACARLDDNTVWCWGDNDQGQLGIGTTTPVEGPVQVGLGADVPVELEVGGRFACIRRASDRSLVCWGGGRYLLLGDTVDPMMRVPHPTPIVIAGTAGTNSFVLGHRHGCGLDAGGQMFCWGKGEEGQLGVGLTSSATPVRPAGISPVQSIDATNRVTCVAFVGGGVRCWGSRYLGGASFDQYPPTVYVTDGVAVGTSNYSACAVHADTSVSCWGYLRDQMPAGLDNAPTPLGLSGIVSIHGGWYHYCAFTMTGALVCWGEDRKGQLGRGTTDSDPRPAPVAVTCD